MKQSTSPGAMEIIIPYDPTVGFCFIHSVATFTANTTNTTPMPAKEIPFAIRCINSAGNTTNLNNIKAENLETEMANAMKFLQNN